jgi:hypothetical protein
MNLEVANGIRLTEFRRTDQDALIEFATVSALALTLLAAQPEAKEPPSGFLGYLQKGQAVGLKDLGSAFEITVFPNGPAPLGYEVVEVGRDFVVLQDITKIQEVRIPVYSVKSITTLKVGN